MCNVLNYPWLSWVPAISEAGNYRYELERSFATNSPSLTDIGASSIKFTPEATTGLFSLCSTNVFGPTCGFLVPGTSGD
jgi:hypothetical protein